MSVSFHLRLDQPRFLGQKFFGTSEDMAFIAFHINLNEINLVLGKLVVLDFIKYFHNKSSARMVITHRWNARVRVIPTRDITIADVVVGRYQVAMLIGITQTPKPCW